MKTWVKYTIVGLVIIAIILLIKNARANNSTPANTNPNVINNNGSAPSILSFPTTKGPKGSTKPLCPNGGIWVPVAGGLGYCSYLNAA